MTDRSGIEIDYCPQCRGVWLDRGELDKIIERSLVGTGGAPAQAPGPQRSYPDPAYGYDKRGDGYDQRGDHHGGGHGNRRRRGWLGELFD